MPIRRKDVIAYAESVNDGSYGHCTTCAHYGKAIVCDMCYCGSRYSFEWRCYLADSRNAIVSFLNCNRKEEK